MNSFYGMTRTACLWIAVLAAVLGGFKIYQKWHRGEPVIPLLLGWVFGMTVALIAIELVDFYLVGGYYTGQTVDKAARGLSIQAHQAALVVGVILSLFSVVTLYQKFNEGEDVFHLLYKWLGSLIFLFLFGYLIEAIF